VDRCNKLPNIKITDPVYNILYDRRLFEIAYHNLKSKPGNMTPGINPETLDGISMEWIDGTIAQLKDESFSFKPGRRVQIPKANGGTRPLTVAPPRDKIVQEAIRIILSAIYEPSFSDNSHGFRPGKGCHSALRQVKTQFGSASWYIEGDISKCFDSFDHHTLMNIIEDKISDRRFTNLIWKALRAGYFEFREYKHSIVGTPQGSVVSPTLANIYLDKLDKFVEQIQANYHKGETAKRNPAWRRLETLRGKALKAGDNSRARDILREMQTIPSRLANDPEFRRLYYVRYADDWIIAARGPRSDVTDILNRIRDFLKEELNLTLSEAKTSITNPRTDAALFLGTKISISQHKYYSQRPNGVKVRSASQIRLLAPMDRLYKKLASSGFVQANQKVGIPRFLWLHNEKDEIIKLYNSVLRGYLNYYSFAMNYGTMAASLRFLLFTSCAKLLAAKYKLGSVLKVMDKFGPQLRGNSNVEFLNPKLNLRPWDFKVGVSTHILALYSSGLSAATLDGLECSFCGSTYRVEMHHVRKLKDLNPKLSHIDRIMAKRRRKQIPLCRACHMEHHRSK
jgi:group II intron reverse transcriptase/maturase